MNLIQKGKSAALNALNRGRQAVAYVAAVALIGLLTMQAKAEPAIELPDTGVDIEGLIGAAILGLGSIVVVAVGGYFGFLLVRLGLRWARTMAG
ncbi:MAG: hypothetical protein WD151_15130 [Phycisphaeraceae bacterium]